MEGVQARGASIKRDQMFSKESRNSFLEEVMTKGRPTGGGERKKGK